MQRFKKVTLNYLIGSVILVSNLAFADVACHGDGNHLVKFNLINQTDRLMHFKMTSSGSELKNPELFYKKNNLIFPSVRDNNIQVCFNSAMQNGDDSGDNSYFRFNIYTTDLNGNYPTPPIQVTFKNYKFVAVNNTVPVQAPNPVILQGGQYSIKPSLEGNGCNMTECNVNLKLVQDGNNFTWKS